MKRKPLTQREAARILSLADRGMGRRAIARETGLPQWTVRRTLEELRPSKTGEISHTDRMRERLDLAEFAALKKRRTLYEIIGENILRAVQAFPPPKAPKPDPLRFRRKHEPEEMVLLFSDSQIGQLVDQKESGGLGAYNVDIFLEHLEFLKISLKKIFEIHLDNTPYLVFNIFFLGDIVEGSTIFPGQERQTDMHVVEQVMFAVDKIAEFVAWIAALYPWKIRCYCVVGNHGRVGKKSEQSPLNNFDVLVYNYISEKLKNYPSVEFHISRSWWMLVERMKHLFLLVHGDDIRAWMGIPYYGIERSESRYQKMIGGAGEGFHYFCCGHHHQEAAIKSRIFVNGSWVGGSEFSIKTLQVASPPSQLLFSVHPLFGVTWERNLRLQDPEKRVPIEVYR